MKTILITTLLLTFQLAQAEPISALKDWTAEKDVITVLGETGCIAETRFTDESNNNWYLQVIKLKSQNGNYSAPVVTAYPETTPTDEYFEAMAQSNASGTQEFSMTLLQPKNQQINPVGSRMVDRTEMLRRIRADSTFTVKFLSKETVTKEVPFSLRGSSATIDSMVSTCQ